MNPKVKIIMFCFFLVSNSITHALPVTGTRNLPDNYTPGQTVAVSLDLEVDENNKPESVIVKEKLPDLDWANVDITATPMFSNNDPSFPAKYYKNTGQLEWLFVDGLMGFSITDTSMDISYQVTAPSDATGAKTFDGDLLYNPGNITQDISGDTQIGSAIVVSADLSTVEATTPVTADGTSTSTITITARDTNGNPIQGIAAADIIVSSTGTGNSITQPATDTDASGQTTATISSTVAEIKTISVAIDVTTITNTASVEFTAVVLPIVAFSSSASSGSEAKSAVSLPVELSKQSAENITVSYSVTGGTATGNDYTLDSGSLTFSAGQTSNNIPLTIINDSLYENDETVIVTLSAPVNATLGSPATHTYTITNDDPMPTIGFDIGSSSNNEDNSPAELTVNISAVSGLDSTVHYTVTGGTASSGTDYTSVSGTLTFPAGDTDSQTISIPIIDDELDEDNETIIVTLSNPTNASIGNASHTYTIIDNDDPPGVSITSSGPLSGDEGAVSQVTMVVNLSKPSGKTVTVDYLVSGDADEGDDYTVAAGPLTFSPGEISKNITLTIVDDNIGELDETVIVTITNATNANIGTPASYTYTITNDDKSSIEFTEISSSGLETVSPATLTVKLAPSFPGTVTVNYSVISGTATGGGEDYTLVSGTLTFAAGETEKYINITIINDELHESDETIVVQLSNPSNNAMIGTKASHTYTINDDDSEPSVEFSVDNSAGPESSSPAVLTVNISAASGLDVTVDYSVTGGTADGGVDYTSVSGTLTFPANETVPKTISIPITDDLLDEEDNETIIVTLSNPSNATLGTNTTHTYTINDDDDMPSVEFSSAGSEGQENLVSQKTLVVNLSEASGRIVTVGYSLNGTAEEGVDYSLAPGSLTFSPGETTKNIMLTIVNDNAGEADETVIVTLEPTNATLGTNSIYTYKIINDDKSSVEFTSASSTGPEADSPVVLSVSLLPAIDQQVTVDYSITGGTASEGGDYTLLGTGTLTFSQLQTEETITLEIADDSEVEPDETIEITLSNPSIHATIGTNASHTYTIINDDDATGPEISGYIPEPDSIQIARDTIIQLHITDEMIGSTSGVNIETVIIRVEGVIIYDGANADPDGTYVSAMGTCRRLGSEEDYMFTFKLKTDPEPPTLFDYEQEVNVEINAEDNAGNILDENYSFYTILRTFGKNIKVNSDTDTLEQNNPATAMDPAGNTWVVFDQTTEAGDTDIYIGKLLKDGSAFELSQLVFGGPGDQLNPAIAIDDDGLLYVVCEEFADPEWDIKLLTSEDGINWTCDSNPVNDNLPADPPKPDPETRNPAIAINGTKICVTWDETRENVKDIWVREGNIQKDSSFAIDWQEQRQVTDENAVNPTKPAIVIYNPVVIGWTDGADIYGAASDSDTPWENEKAVTTKSPQTSLSMAVDDLDDVHVLWIDDVDEDNINNIYYDTGDLPLTGENIIDEQGKNQSNPAIAVWGIEDPVKVFACWEDARNLEDYQDPADIYYAEMTENLFGTNIRVIDEPGSNIQTAPDIGVDNNGNPFMVWVDDRNGNNDIYYAHAITMADPLPTTVDVDADNSTIVEATTSDNLKVTVKIPDQPLGVPPSDITVREVDIENLAELPTEGFPMCYDLGPNGLNFSEPVTITMLHQADYEHPDHDVFIVYYYKYDQLTGLGAWEQLTDEAEHLNSDHPDIPDGFHAIRFTAEHFTVFGVGGSSTIAPVGGGGGGGGCSVSVGSEGNIVEFILPYIGFFVVLVILTIRDTRVRKIRNKIEGRH